MYNILSFNLLRLVELYMINLHLYGGGGGLMKCFMKGKPRAPKLVSNLKTLEYKDVMLAQIFLKQLLLQIENAFDEVPICWVFLLHTLFTAL